MTASAPEFNPDAAYARERRNPVPVVLASSSPSRLTLLRNAGVEPVVAPVAVDEEAILAACGQISSLADAESAVLALASAKAAAAHLNPQAVTIAADSMLLLDGQLQGKPHTVAETIRRWQAQRGRTAHLITGHALSFGDARFSGVSTTAVTFGNPSDADIRAYAESGEPLGCAGAFTLEALGSWFIDRIEGDPSGVIGLSMPVVQRALRSFGLDVSQTWNRPESMGQGDPLPPAPRVADSPK